MLIKTIKSENLIAEVYDSRVNMGKAAANFAVDAIKKVIEEKGSANVIFAAAPSQNETLEAFLSSDLDFTKIHAFHMDEYVGLSIDNEQSFARYLYDHVFSKAPFASVNYLPATEDIDVACEKYSELLRSNPVDVVLMGIGENGHIAFNDPPVADFKDTALVKKVKLDEVCRMQQVHDGCFPTIDDVPKYALTLTVPALMSAKTLVCTVPAPTKAKAVNATLFSKYSEACPATSMRRHANAKMFLDTDSAADIAKPIKILFYGFRHGHVNSMYKLAIASDKYEVVGCVEENEEARRVAEELLETTFSDIPYEEWLKTDIDAVAFGGAYGDRGAAIIKALEAGKHVIADKPLCTSLKELRKIRSLSEKKGLKVGCMLELRYIGTAQRVKEILDSGRLGKIQNVSFTGQHDLNLDTRQKWYFEKGMHGGTINDIAIHGVDMVRYLTGLELDKVDCARTWNAYAKPYPDFKDCATFMARLDNGAEVMADVSYSSPGWRTPTYWEFRFWCDTGLVYYSYFDKLVRVIERGCAPVDYEGLPVYHNYLDDFHTEIIFGGDTFTKSVLDSTEITLGIQAVADKTK